MAEWKVHRGFLDSDESSDTSAQPQAPHAEGNVPPSSADGRADPRLDEDPLVELARIVSESAANLGRLGTQPGDEPTLILGRATPKPLPLRPEGGPANVPAGGGGSGFVSRATPTLPPNAPPLAPQHMPSGHAAPPRVSTAPMPPPPVAPTGFGGPAVEPPTRGANPLTFEDDLLAELRQSVDPRVTQRPVPPPAGADANRLAAMRAMPRPSGDEPTARVAQVVQSAMSPQRRPPLDDDDGGPTIALNLRGGARPSAAPAPLAPPAAPTGAPAPLASSPLEDGFDDLFADSADRAAPTGLDRAPTAPAPGPKLTAGQPAPHPQGPRLGDNFPRPAVDPTGRGGAQRPKAAAKSRPVRPEPRRSGVGAGLFVAGSVLSVVVLAGLGYLGYRAYATNVAVSDGGVPVIKSVGKVKEEPPARTAQSDTAAPRLAPDRVEDNTKLVTRSEEPVDQVSVGPRRITAGAPGTVVPQPAGDQPRTVKTVVVRPDGSVVQQATPAPAPTPVRTQPVSAETTPLVAVAPQAVPVPVAPAPKDLIGQQIAPPVAPAPIAAAPAPTKPAAPAASTASAPAPRLAAQPTPVAPATRPTAPAGAPLALAPQAGTPLAPAPIPGQVQPRLAATPMPPAAVAPPSASAASGEFMVQLSSQKSEAEAQRAISQLQARFAALSGRSMDVQRADLGAKGVYYRVRAAGGSQEQAASLCGQVKAAGGDCMVTKR